MNQRINYLNHIDPEYQRWGRIYRVFPGVAECVRLILDNKATGAWADIIHFELAASASVHLEEMIEACNDNPDNHVAINMLMALEKAALPQSVPFLANVFRGGNERLAAYAKRALIAINTKESRTVLFLSPNE